MINLGGTWRENTAEQTLARITPMLWSTFGISRIADITGLDNLGIHTMVAIRPNSKALSNSQGKGLTANLAKASAIMESIELWHGENLPEADLSGNYESLKSSYPLILPEPLQAALFTPFINQLSMPWVEVTHLLTQTNSYLPQIIFNQNRADYGGHFELFWPSSNGLASGNTREEALCHALFELIERDCLHHMTRSGGLKRQLDLKHLPSAYCQDLVQGILDHGVELRLYDIRHELEIPCYYASIDDGHNLRHVGSFAGYGCHFSDEVALLRAVTEAAQSRLTYISGARDDIVTSFYRKKNPPVPVYATGDYRPEYNDWQGDSMTKCLDQLINRLYAHGHQQMFFYDLTRSDINIPVVHAVVPSLQFNQAHHLFKIEAPL